jgi:hypothetical protein
MKAPVILALLFVVLQAAALCAAQANGSDSGSSQAGVLQTVLLAQNTAPVAGAAPPSSAPSQSVKVTELPPISTNKDWTDWSYWIFTFFLAVIGGLQAFLLWGSMVAFRLQVKQMQMQTEILSRSVALAEKSAETASQNLQMFMNRERGHLRVELTPIEWPLQPGAPKLNYKVTLYGSTEAYVTSSCARAEVTESPEPLDDPHWFPAMAIPQVITPENRVVEGCVQGVFPRMRLEQSDIEAIEAGKKFIHFRGFVKYNDVFGTERWARFRRVWDLSPARNTDGTRSGHWGKRGGVKDNSES